MDIRKKLIHGTIGGMETRMLLVPMAFALIFWILSLLMGTSEYVNEFDRSVIQWLYATPESDPLGYRDLRHNARDLTALGSPFLLVALAVIGIIWLIGHRDKYGLAFLAVVAIGGTILTFGLKELYGRERPPYTTTYLLESSPSFPSGHSLLTAALLPAIAIIFLRQERVPTIHRMFLTIGILLAIIVGLTRIVLGAHYPTDVMAGWAAGFGWVALCRAGLGVFENRHVEPQVPASGV